VYTVYSEKQGKTVDNFLIAVEFDADSSTYRASFAQGNDVELDANNYFDAVLEAALIEVDQ
jgi:hypothetical protein